MDRLFRMQFIRDKWPRDATKHEKIAIRCILVKSHIIPAFLRRIESSVQTLTLCSFIISQSRVTTEK